MKTYVTFGQVHYHIIDNKVFDKDCVAVIEADNEAKGRNMAFELFGPKFFTTYTEETFDPSDLEYFPRGLIRVEDSA